MFVRILGKSYTEGGKGNCALKIGKEISITSRNTLYRSKRSLTYSYLNKNESKSSVHNFKETLKKKIKLNINSRNKMTITICHFKSLACRKTLCVGVIINDDVNTVCRCGSTCQLDARRHGGQRSVLRFAVFTDNNLEYRTFYFPVGF